MDAIKDKLKSIADAVELDNTVVFASVFYGSNFETNAKADDAVFPMCQIVQILSSGFTINPVGAGCKDNYNVFIFFCDKTPDTDLDTTGELNEAVIEHMRIACKRFIGDVNKDGSFGIVTKVDLKHIYFKFDASVSGILAFFNVVDLTGKKLC